MDNNEAAQKLGELLSSFTQKAGVTDVKNATFERKGSKIIIPEGMSFRDAKLWLERKQQEEETEVQVDEPIHGYPFDAALAFTKAMSETYGWSNMVPTPGFFGSRPPVMLSIETGFGETTQVPWGRCKIPGVEGYLNTGIDVRDGLPILTIGGVVLQKHKEEVHKLCELARKILEEQSIYRGKAVRINFPTEEELENGTLDVRQAPKFLDLSLVKEEELIFPQDTLELVRSSIFTPVRHTQSCRDANIPLKRGVLLEGPFGVGKTLTAYVTAKMCEENGWTFIYLDDLDDLPTAVRFAKKYEPALIFAEDIDRAVGVERSDSANDILNTIDGIDSKNRELMVVLTTNNVDKIHPAMLRPGRLDAVIPVRPPDAIAAERLVRLYGRGLIGENEDLSGAGAKLEGQIPAVIREVVERSKLSAISRQDGEGQLVLTGNDLEQAAAGMLTHLKLIEPRPRDERSDREKAADRLGNLQLEAAKITASNNSTNTTEDNVTTGSAPYKHITPKHLTVEVK